MRIRKLTTLIFFIIGVSHIFGNISFIEQRLAHAMIYSMQDSTIEDLDSTATLSLSNSYIPPGKPMLYSGLLPGLGQAYLGSWKRAIIFGAVEGVAFGTWYQNNKLGNNQQDKYIAYASEHWSFARWIHDYYKWYNYDENNPDSEHNKLREIFINYTDSTTGCAQDPTLPNCYPDLWESSHNISFTWKNGNYPYRFVTTNDKLNDQYIFRDIFKDLCDNAFDYDKKCTIELEELEEKLKDYDVEIEFNHHFYENIGKYDPFFPGWEDNDSLTLYIKPVSGELLAMSPNKRGYRNIWEKANEKYFKIATYALSVLMANHVTSMLDALISAKLLNIKNEIDISAQPYYDPRNKWGVGGVKLMVKW